MVGQPAQLAQATSQTVWCADVERALAALDRPAALAGVKRGCVAQLAELAAMVRAELAPIARLSMASLVTLFVHARDVTVALFKCAPALQIVSKRPHGGADGFSHGWLFASIAALQSMLAWMLSRSVLQ